ncbi:MAG: dihydroorotate dehydrogenase-like protein [Acidobacteria bacterium]|nr:dihydroorotate dehydrogenase-like protein [Acidobacteriota bacterium]MCB9397777.1 dihydroorotate dehydrogenase-like protein [Acidobacteriota bacterium]
MSKPDLTSQYLGLSLKNPIVPSAGPLSRNLDSIKQMEDAGAAALVLYSLFEEEIFQTEMEHHATTLLPSESFAEALSYFPEQPELRIGPDQYLEHVRRCKESVEIPIIASLNGITRGGWIDYARQIEQAGANALELNMYMIPTDFEMSGGQVEHHYLEIVRAIRAAVSIPIAVKLSPFFSAMAWFARHLDETGIQGLVLFNRFYQPDIDLENLEVVPNVILSTPMAMRLPLRWIAILYGRIHADLAATSGINSGKDILKLTMAGASVCQVLSCLLRHGIPHIQSMLNELETWMETHEYESLDQMRGSMSHRSVGNPGAFERANYYKALHNYQL